MFLLGPSLEFPPVERASPEGILAFGGDLSPERLILAYQNGIFPWYNEGEPIIWYSPDPRMVLFLDELKVSKSMARLMRKNEFTVTMNQDFKQVIENCQHAPRKDQLGTWITEDMKQAYIKLNQLGFAKSVEVWKGSELVGGLYGIDLGHVFCGESMFSKVSNTSKLAFIYLVQTLSEKNYRLIDCQVYNEHLESLGAREISRADFMKILKPDRKHE
ncbi:leucyl/phenylalanyl-tRNA--protein transferase [Lutimonas zeaxanthinifaciens]|uniref:leucyl/phenylalanyl-tRNA--protein transferase n=1 Tax=Lutimonas zeaxanthinifaciens TaxID=3060215 RepID=UPI00265D2E41|nr:leucyl/phenylalanyl-tRNA--protein transferase [Lutimonas sp. YSD2104]WKK66324.1 leucyl/phenylalanyl-tRNA--protein transferase [Lutimonas sp. YSD2104]